MSLDASIRMGLACVVVYFALYGGATMATKNGDPFWIGIIFVLLAAMPLCKPIGRGLWLTDQIRKGKSE